jgi:hypothetical protein
MDQNKLSYDNISFLTDINNRYRVDKTNRYYYHLVSGFNIFNVQTFLSSIRNDDIMLIFPFISITKNPDDPYLRLSNQFLVNKDSNAKLISEFIQYQFNNSDFNIDQGSSSYSYFKYKKVYISRIEL